MKYRVTGKKPEENRPSHSLHTIIDVIDAPNEKAAADKFCRMYKGYSVVQSELHI